MRFLPGLIANALWVAASLLLPASIFAAPPPGVLDLSHASVRAVIAVQEQVTPEFMQQPDVLGTAVGVDATGAPALTVYVDRDAANAGTVIQSLPRNVRGVGVHVELTDKFRAMARPGGGGRETNAADPARHIWRLEQGPRKWLLLRRYVRIVGSDRHQAVHLEQLSRVRIGHRVGWQWHSCNDWGPNYSTRINRRELHCGERAECCHVGEKELSS